MDTTEYLDVFIDESTEHLNVLSKNFLELEKNPTESDALIEEVFRNAHTLKGMAATMGYEELSNLTHEMENAFERIRNGDLIVNADMMDALFAALDMLNEMVEDISKGGDGKQDVTVVSERLNTLKNDNDPASSLVAGALAKDVQEKDAPEPEGSSTQTPGVFTSLNEFELSILSEAKDRGFSHYEITVQLDKDCLLKGARVFMVFDVLEKFGEVMKSNPTVDVLEEESFDNTFSVLLVSNYSEADIKHAIQKVSELGSVVVCPFDGTKSTSGQNEPASGESENKTKAIKTYSDQRKKVANKTIRVNIERLDKLMNLFDEFVIDCRRLEVISGELEHPKLKDTVEKITRVSSDLQDHILTLRMVPIEQVFLRFPRMIRQLARDLGKEIGIDVIGAETEVDRTVIDEIGDPLMHLIRNAIDHGIESPEERIKQHKAQEGIIKLMAYHSGNHIFIEITDDGAGINQTKVIEKAIKNNILTSDQADGLSDGQVNELIMAGGFSTSDEVTDISGRGVGLDVVKDTIESLGGHITIASELGKGSTFSIQLPLTLSICNLLSLN